MTDTQEEHKQPRKHNKPTRRAWIMRGVVTPIFGLLAIACIVFGVLNSTIWKPSSSITATAEVSNTRYLMIDAGVLNLVDPSVTVTVTSGTSASSSNTDSNTTTDSDTQSSDNQANTDEVKTCIAVGTGKDVTGWLSGESYTRVTGLTSWESLATSNEQPQGKASTSENQVNFADSDMWTHITCGTGKVSMSLKKAQSTEVALIDFGSQVKQATISMHWVRQSIPDFALPWYFGGGLCVILAILSASVFAMEPSVRRKKETEIKAVTSQEKQATDEPKISEALVGTLSVLKPGRGKKSSNKPRRRHARHSGSSQTTPTTEATPTIVDPSARNLVAEKHADNEQQSQEVQESISETTVGETTSVISEDELQAYFARLAQEVNAENETSTNTEQPSQPEGKESE